MHVPMAAAQAPNLGARSQGTCRYHRRAAMHVYAARRAAPCSQSLEAAAVEGPSHSPRREKGQMLRCRSLQRRQESRRAAHMLIARRSEAAHRPSPRETTALAERCQLHLHTHAAAASAPPKARSRRSNGHMLPSSTAESPAPCRARVQRVCLAQVPHGQPLRRQLPARSCAPQLHEEMGAQTQWSARSERQSSCAGVMKTPLQPVSRCLHPSVAFPHQAAGMMSLSARALCAR